MKLLRTRTELRAWREQVAPGQSVGFVPTMGALHEGHLSLVRDSHAMCDLTVVSVFVNPTQFGPGEDFNKYPRDFNRDRELLEIEGVDALFAPEPGEMYLGDASTAVLEKSVSTALCGAFRPGHFEGVATVVLKLFNLIQPQLAFFGQKDAQQCAVIERVVRDLDVPVTIVRGETVREGDGLAMSSRNAYLSPAHREKAPLIYKSLRLAAEAFARGERDAAKLASIGRAVLAADPEFRVQYWEVVHPTTLASLGEVGSAGALLAAAVYLGGTRLIDNLQTGPGFPE